MLRSIRAAYIPSRAVVSRKELLSTAPSNLSDQLQVHHLMPKDTLVPKLQFFNSVTSGSGQIPTYRVLDGAGKLTEGGQLPDVCKFDLSALSSPLSFSQMLDEAFARKL